MALQETPFPATSIFYIGLFKIAESAKASRLLIDRVFGEIYIDPTNDWQNIRSIFECFGCSKMQANAGASKDEEQGDGTKAPWISGSVRRGELVKIFDLSEKLGLLIEPDDVRVTMDGSSPLENRNLLLWKGLAKAYEFIREKETTCVAAGFIVAPMMGLEKPFNRSPAQIGMMASSLCKYFPTTEERYGVEILEGAYPLVLRFLETGSSGALHSIFSGQWLELIPTMPDLAELEVSETDGFEGIDIPQTPEGDFLPIKSNAWPGSSFAFETNCLHIKALIKIPDGTTPPSCFGEYGAYPECNPGGDSPCPAIADCTAAESYSPMAVTMDGEYVLQVGMTSGTYRIIKKHISVAP